MSEPPPERLKWCPLHGAQHTRRMKCPVKPTAAFSNYDEPCNEPLALYKLVAKPKGRTHA